MSTIPLDSLVSTYFVDSSASIRIVSFNTIHRIVSFNTIHRIVSFNTIHRLVSVANLIKSPSHQVVDQKCFLKLGQQLARSPNPSRLSQQPMRAAQHRTVAHGLGSTCGWPRSGRKRSVREAEERRGGEETTRQSHDAASSEASTCGQQVELESEDSPPCVGLFFVF